MSGIMLSACCGAAVSEHETEDDSVKYWCGACRRMCKIARPEKEVKPRSAVQAYNDQFNPDGSLKEENFTMDDEGPLEAPQTPVEPSNSELEVRDGLIYQNGKVIGKSLSDEEWFRETYKEDWQGSSEALSMLRNK